MKNKYDGGGRFRPPPVVCEIDFESLVFHFVIRPKEKVKKMRLIRSRARKIPNRTLNNTQHQYRSTVNNIGSTTAQRPQYVPSRHEIESVSSMVLSIVDKSENLSVSELLKSLKEVASEQVDADVQALMMEREINWIDEAVKELQSKQQALRHKGMTASVQSLKLKRQVGQLWNTSSKGSLSLRQLMVQRSLELPTPSEKSFQSTSDGAQSLTLSNYNSEARLNSSTSNAASSTNSASSKTCFVYPSSLQRLVQPPPTDWEDAAITWPGRPIGSESTVSIVVSPASTAHYYQYGGAS
eukprot:Filipodium_phascolosomae@DN2100_c0_g1_i1.p1